MIASVHGLLSFFPRQILAQHGIPKEKISIVAESMYEMWYSSLLMLGVLSYCVSRFSFAQSVGYACFVGVAADLRHLFTRCEQLGEPKGPMIAWAIVESLAGIFALNNGFGYVNIQAITKLIASIYVLQGAAAALFAKSTLKAYGML